MMRHVGYMNIQPFLFHIRYMAFFSVQFPCFSQHLLTTGIDSHSTLVTVNNRSQDSFFHWTWDDMIKEKLAKYEILTNFRTISKDEGNIN